MRRHRREHTDPEDTAVETVENEKQTSPAMPCMGLLPQFSSPFGLLCDNRAIPCKSLSFTSWQEVEPCQ